MNTIEFKVITPDTVLLQENAQAVMVPASSGYMGILPGHMKYLAQLQPGTVRYTPAGKTEQAITIKDGFVHITPTAVTVYTIAAGVKS